MSDKWMTIVRRIFYVAVPISCAASGMTALAWFTDKGHPLIGFAVMILTWLGALCAEDMIENTLAPKDASHD